MAQKGRNLSDMYAGQQATLMTIQGSKALCDRLTALGFLEGTRVCCLGAGPFGDPVAYEVRHTVIALRRADSIGIEVSVS